MIAISAGVARAVAASVLLVHTRSALLGRRHDALLESKEQVE
jgi:hypothetical protein